MSTSESHHSTVRKFDFFLKKEKSRSLLSWEYRRYYVKTTMFSFFYAAMPVTRTVVRAEHMLTNRLIQVKCE